MSKVYFAYNPFLKESKVLINDETISPYSSLNNYLLHPFDHFCMNLVDTIYREINGSYELEFCSGAFETFIMKVLVQSRPEVSFSERPFSNGLTIQDRFALLRKNGFSLPKESAVNLCISGSVDGAAFAAGLCGTQDFSAGDGSVRYLRYADANPVSLYINADPASDVDLTIGLFSDPREAVMFCKAARNGIPCVAVTLADTLRVETAANKYLLSMRAEDLIALLPDLLDSLVVSKTITAAAQNAGLYFRSGEEKELITAIDPVVRITCNDKVAHNCSYTPIIQVFPQDSEVPQITIESSDSMIVRSSGNTIVGVSPGAAVVDFYIKGYYKPILRKTVTVFRVERIERIELSQESVITKAGEEFALTGTVYPQNAQNLSSLVWRSNNPSVATVDPSGIIRTLAPGSCVISLSTEDVSAYCQIEVAPSVEYIQLQAGNNVVIQGDKITSIIQQHIPIQPIAFPANAYDTSISYEIHSDNGAYPCVQYHDGILETLGVGRATITFISNDSGVRYTLNVEVINTLNPPRNPSKAVSILALIVSGILAFIEPGIGIIAALAAVGFACIGLAVAQKIRQRLSLIVGYGRKYPVSDNYILIVLSIAALILNNVLLCS